MSLGQQFLRFEIDIKVDLETSGEEFGISVTTFFLINLVQHPFRVDGCTHKIGPV